MAKLAEAIIELTASDKGLKTALTKAEKDVNAATQKMQARVNQLGSIFTGIGTGLTVGLTAPILGMLTLATSSAAQAADAAATLAAAMKQAGTYTQGALDALTDYAATLQKTTVYSDELIATTMAYGINLGIQTNRIEEATKAAMGLAARYRIDLQTAMMLLGRASLGNTMMLKRYGIVLSETLSPQEKFNKLLEIGAGSFGLAEAEGKRFTGQLMRLRNAVDELMESLGTPIIQTFARDLERLIGALQGITIRPEMARAIIVFGLMAASIGPIILAATKLTVTLLSLDLQAKMTGSSLRALAASSALKATPYLTLGIAVGTVVAAVAALALAYEAGVIAADKYRNSMVKLANLRRQQIVADESQKTREKSINLAMADVGIKQAELERAKQDQRMIKRGGEGLGKIGGWIGQKVTGLSNEQLAVAAKLDIQKRTKALDDAKRTLDNVLKERGTYAASGSGFSITERKAKAEKASGGMAAAGPQFSGLTEVRDALRLERAGMGASPQVQQVSLLQKINTQMEKQTQLNEDWVEKLSRILATA